MTEHILELAQRFAQGGSLTDQELVRLIDGRTAETALLLQKKAQETAQSVFGNKIYIRGLIEFTNHCKNDCYYCGIRRSNRQAQRYRLTTAEILSCCEVGYPLGFRTFVLQGGEDPYFTDERLCEAVSAIKGEYPDCAVTLSVGERSEDSYRRLKAAGADRFLLRHETATEIHYAALHPPELSLTHRMDCLRALKRLGYQTGCGFMVGSPHQTTEMLVRDLRFITAFQPQMVGIGPFLSHKDTPFRSEPNGSADLTVYLLSMVRILLPRVLLPATTALGTAESGGRERGILHGANVVMPNLSPDTAKRNYMLYDNKLTSGAEAGESLTLLAESLDKIGYEIAYTRGDAPTM